MIQHVTAHTINCVCHSIMSMFRVLGMYNFDQYFKSALHREDLSWVPLNNASDIFLSEKKKKNVNPSIYPSNEESCL